jgi:hypothetical protein
MHSTGILQNYSLLSLEKKSDPQVINGLVKLLAELRKQLMADLTKCLNHRLARALQEGNGLVDPSSDHGGKFQNLKAVRAYLTGPNVQEGVIEAVRNLVEHKVRAKNTYTNTAMAVYLMKKFGFGLHPSSHQPDTGSTANSFRQLVQEQHGNWKNSTNRALATASLKVEIETWELKNPGSTHPLATKIRAKPKATQHPHAPMPSIGRSCPPIPTPNIYPETFRESSTQLHSSQNSSRISNFEKYPTAFQDRAEEPGSRRRDESNDLPLTSTARASNGLSEAINLVGSLNQDTSYKPPSEASHSRRSVTEVTTREPPPDVANTLPSHPTIPDAANSDESQRQVILSLYAQKILTMEQTLAALDGLSPGPDSHGAIAASEPAATAPTASQGEKPDDSAKSATSATVAPHESVLRGPPDDSAKTDTSAKVAQDRPEDSAEKELSTGRPVHSAKTGPDSSVNSALSAAGLHSAQDSAVGRHEDKDDGDDDGEGGPTDFADGPNYGDDDGDGGPTDFADGPNHGNDDGEGGPTDLAEGPGDSGGNENGDANLGQGGGPTDNPGERGQAKTGDGKPRSKIPTGAVTLHVPLENGTPSLLNLSDQTLATQNQKDKAKLDKKKEEEEKKKKQEQERKEKREQMALEKQRQEAEKKEKMEEDKRRKRAAADLAKEEAEQKKAAAKAKKANARLVKEQRAEEAKRRKVAAGPTKTGSKKQKDKQPPSRELGALIDVWGPTPVAPADMSPQMHTRSHTGRIARVTRGKNRYLLHKRALPTRYNRRSDCNPAPGKEKEHPADVHEGPQWKKTKLQATPSHTNVETTTVAAKKLQAKVADPIDGLVSVKFERVSVLQPLGFKCDYRMIIVDIKAGDVAARSNLELGMRLVAVNGKQVTTNDDVLALCQNETRFDLHLALPTVRTMRMPEPPTTLPFYRCEVHRTLLKEWESGAGTDVDYYMAPNRFLFQAVCSGCPRQRDDAGNIKVYKESKGHDGQIIPAVPKRHESCPEGGGLVERFRGTSAKRSSVCYWACRKCCQQFDAARMSTEEMQGVSVICNDCYLDYVDERDANLCSQGKRSSRRR